ncbi:MAG: response regulator [Syntrophobacterales bacterium]|nr:response regulator [Syntrophobacterales bacterium]
MNKQIKEEPGSMAADSLTDNLTGLLNHDVFQLILELESIKSHRYGTPFTLALLNLDSFSLYDRQNGTSKGDSILRETARIIKETIRQCDIAARYSGNIFAVILIRSDAELSHTAVERIRLEFEKFTGGELTMSAGLVTCPRDAANRNSLIEKAMEALSKAGADGENRIYFSRSEAQPAAGSKPMILLVDDDRRNVRFMEALLDASDYDYDVIKAYDGNEALSIIGGTEVDLVLLDIMMPDLNGYEVCRRLKENEGTRMIPVIMLTALSDSADKINGIKAGADDFIVKPPDRSELIARINSLLNANSLNKKLTSIENVLISMTNAVEAKDIYTQGHSARVSDMAVSLGRKMNLPEEEIYALRIGGILHDIGKIGIPGGILNRPGTLMPDEFEIIKTHSEAGYRICQPLQKTLGPALDVIRHHHEKLDGSGYPDGLKGKDISVISRIMCIADIFDALTSSRPYRGAMSRKEAFEILNKEADEGKLDKEIVGHLRKLTGKL